MDNIYDDDDVNIDNYYLILEIQNQKYAIPIKNIYQIIQIKEITKIPNSSDYMRGLLKNQDENIKIIDTRTRLKLNSLDKDLNELIQTLKLREEDHKIWLKELENSVLEKREFKLTTDHHACKFGIWYDNYETSNQTLSAFLERFDKPHKEIHKVAIKVNELVKGNDYESALKVVESAKNKELKRMIELFERLYSIILDSNREIAILVNDNGSKTAISVDNIDNITYLTDDLINWGHESKFVEGHTIIEDITVLILNESIYKL